jgi:exodeoxyribonuclease III
VRARVALVERLIVEQQPDILCLQETKALDTSFPPTVPPHGYVHISSSKGSGCTTG